MNPQIKQAYAHFKRAGTAHIVGQYAEACLAMARADWLKNQLLQSEELEIEWDYDDFLDHPRDWGWSEKQCAEWEEEDHTQEQVTLRLNGEIIGSLGGIWDADADYRRGIEAELLLEAAPFTALGWKMVTKEG